MSPRLTVFSVLLLMTGSSAAVVACSESTSGLGLATMEAGADAPLVDTGSDSTALVEAGEAAVHDGAPDAEGADSRLDSGEGDATVRDAEGGSDSPADTLAEGSASDASCDGVVCAGQCLEANDCRTCAGAPLLCSLTGQCVADCSGCTTGEAGLPTECFACDQNHQNPVGTCQPDDTSAYCLSGSDFGSYIDGSSGYYCECGDGGANGCPGHEQVCAPLGLASFCLSCGQITTVSLDEAGCSGGGSCNESLRTCR